MSTVDMRGHPVDNSFTYTDTEEDLPRGFETLSTFAHEPKNQPQSVDISFSEKIGKFSETCSENRTGAKKGSRGPSVGAEPKRILSMGGGVLRTRNRQDPAGLRTISVIVH